MVVLTDGCGDQDLRWQQAIVPLDASIADGIASLNQAGVRIVLVVRADGGFVGTVSDGDIRRGLLRGLGMATPIAEIVHRNALVVPPELARETVQQLMVANKIQQVPVIDANGRVVGLHLWDTLSLPPKRDNLMVVMAGGKGVRLRPYTENCPKPMLEVAGRPMLEHILERAKQEGFCHFVLAIHYLGHMIEDYFCHGEKWQVKIDYLREDHPLGTAGALSLLNPAPTKAFVVTNGDVLSDIHYGGLLDFHARNTAAATMAVRAYEWHHPFGVVHTSGVDITGFEEKPVVRSHINAGVYALSPHVLTHIPAGEHCDMPTLFERLRAVSERTVAYPMHEPWLDVGRPDDLSAANKRY